MSEFINPLDFEPVPARGNIDKIEEMGTCAFEAKLDGTRQLLSKISGEVMLTGRRRSVNTGLMHNKIGHVPHIKAWAERNLWNIVLDGELVSPKGGSNATTSILGSKQDRAVLLQSTGVLSQLHYYVFDIIQHYSNEVGMGVVDWRSVDYARRRGFLEHLFAENFEESPYIHLCPQIPMPTRQDAFEYARSLGYEGIIVKPYAGLYDKKHWAKMKAVSTWDFVIIGYTPSDSFTYAGNGVATVELALADSKGQLCHCCSCGGLTEEWRYEFYHDYLQRNAAQPTKYIGTVCEITGQEMFETGAVRHPRFKQLRPELNPLRQTFRKYGIER